MKHTIINHNDANISIEKLQGNLKRITVTMNDPGGFCQRECWTTKYTIELIKKILEVKGPSWLCDEIQRDEDHGSVQADLEASIFSYVDKRTFENKTILDFGCGCGSSTAIIARLLPKTHIIGVDINHNFLYVARMRMEYYGIQRYTLLKSQDPGNLPEQIGDVHFIILSAVFEHLLPNERIPLLLQLWDHLLPGGILFINQTPDRRFPIETHTSMLPFLNYCPDKVAFLLSNKFSRRIERAISWNSLLRNGIRGTTPNELLKILSHSRSQAKLLKPIGYRIRHQSDIWYHASKSRISEKYTGIKKLVVLAFIRAILSSRIPVAPYLSLAFKKMR